MSPVTRLSAVPIENERTPFAMSSISAFPDR
jgi:hypothetical protein